MEKDDKQPELPTYVYRFDLVCEQPVAQWRVGGITETGPSPSSDFWAGYMLRPW